MKVFISGIPVLSEYEWTSTTTYGIKGLSTETSMGTLTLYVHPLLDNTNYVYVNATTNDYQL